MRFRLLLITGSVILAITPSPLTPRVRLAVIGQAAAQILTLALPPEEVPVTVRVQNFEQAREMLQKDPTVEGFVAGIGHLQALPNTSNTSLSADVGHVYMHVLGPTKFTKVDELNPRRISVMTLEDGFEVDTERLVCAVKKRPAVSCRAGAGCKVVPPNLGSEPKLTTHLRENAKTKEDEAFIAILTRFELERRGGRDDLTDIVLQRSGTRLLQVPSAIVDAMTQPPCSEAPPYGKATIEQRVGYFNQSDTIATAGQAVLLGHIRPPSSAVQASADRLQDRVWGREPLMDTRSARMGARQIQALKKRFPQITLSQRLSRFVETNAK